MLKDLIKVANKLDEAGLSKEADFLDSLITKLAQETTTPAAAPVSTTPAQKKTLTSVVDKFQKDLSSATVTAKRDQPVSQDVVKKITDVINKLPQASGPSKETGKIKSVSDAVKQTLQNPTPPTPAELDKTIENILAQNPKVIEATNMLSDLSKVANKLDEVGLTKEADFLDSIITKLASEVPVSDNLLKEELNYVVPVWSPEWNWIIPTSWRLSKEHYSSISEQEESHKGIEDGVGMAAFNVKKMSEKLGGDFNASAKRFLELAGESLTGYIDSVSKARDGERLVEAARVKGGEHLREFTKACDHLIAADKAREEGEAARGVRMEAEGDMSNPF
jgi:hypothetical protein